MPRSLPRITTERRPAMARASVILGAGLFALAACRPIAPADFNSPEPAARNAAIVEAARDRNQAAIPDLVRMLESDDPATRVLAIRTLERLTGQTLGYDPTSEAQARERAIEAWVRWCQAPQIEARSTSK